VKQIIKKKCASCWSSSSVCITMRGAEKEKFNFVSYIISAVYNQSTYFIFNILY